MQKKLVYIAHPFGNVKENQLKIDAIMEELVLADTENAYVSPIHNFGFMYLEGDEYVKGLNICLRLLQKCDVLVLAGNWRTSRGCNAEFTLAKKTGIPIYTLDEWKLCIRKEEQSFLDLAKEALNNTTEEEFNEAMKMYMKNMIRK